jgi:sortase A
MSNKKGIIPIVLGSLLILGAVSLSSYNLYDEHRAQTSANNAVSLLEDFIPAPPEQISPADPAQSGLATEIEIPDYILNPNMSMPKQEVQGIDYIATLKIPALELDLPIISDWSYPNLKLAPCRYSGTAYLDNLVIAAHNYKSHFGNLKSLIPGDMVILTDMDGNEFRYEVAAIETLQPTAIEDMTSGDYALTLFTCTLSGSARVTVRCDRVE